MLHHWLERELAHLERVLPQAGSGPFPASYWQTRVAAVSNVGGQPQYRARIERLKKALADIEKIASRVAA